MTWNLTPSFPKLFLPKTQCPENSNPQTQARRQGLCWPSHFRFTFQVVLRKLFPMDPFLQAAIDEARQGIREGGLPIGSVLVRDGKIIGKGPNRRVQHNAPMAHAEIDCLTRAGRKKTYRDTVLYSTLMPCFLCSGAAVQFGVPQ